MLDKLTAAVKQLLTDNRDFSTRLERLEKVKPAVVNGRDGKDGKDGVSPDIETIIAAVVNELPEPEKIDTKAIVNDVLAQIPKPRDGRDAPAVNVSDVAAIVLAKIPTPKDGKDGHNGPDLETVVKRVKAQVKDGAKGEPGPPGPPGKDGKDGVSVTNVQLKNNELFVWLDGVKRAVGKIKIPAASAPFSPGNMGGGSARDADDDYLTSLAQVSVTHPADPTDAQVIVVGTGDPDLPPPAGFVSVESGYEKITEVGKAFTVLPSGKVQINVKGYVKIDGYADIRHSVNNTTAGVAFSITRGGSTIYSARSVHTRMPNAGDIGHLSGDGTYLAEPGDIVGVGFASNISGTIQIRSSSLVFNMIRRA